MALWEIGARAEYQSMVVMRQREEGLGGLAPADGPERQAEHPHAQVEQPGFYTPVNPRHLPERLDPVPLCSTRVCGGVCLKAVGVALLSDCCRTQTTARWNEVWVAIRKFRIISDSTLKWWNEHDGF